MDLWLRRLIGPGPTRDAGPTQPADDACLPWDAAADRIAVPLDDTPAAADTLGWLPSDALADAVTQAELPHEAVHWDHVISYCVIGAVCFALGALVAS